MRALPTRRGLIVFGVLLAATALGSASLGFGLKFDLPDVRALEDYTPPLHTRLLAADGSPLASFGEQRRVLLGHNDIPKVFEQALVAVEDSNFYRHNGIDPWGVARAAWHDLTTLSREQGASTITQQLSRNLFLSAEKTARRKIQEAMLAIEIERHYTKQEILRFYANQVYMGHGRYGLEAASQFYFGKPARELDLPEAALLAGIIQRPEALSPFKAPERAVRRRNHVLTRMTQEGFLSESDAARAREAPLRLASHADTADLAPYFVEEVRRRIQTAYGDDALYQRGLEIRCSLDPALQKIANQAVEAGLRQLDKRQGWRGRTGTVPRDAAPDTWSSPAWRNGVAAGDVTDGVVVRTLPGKVQVRVGPYAGLLDAEAVAWTGRSNPAAFLKPGDVVRVRVEALTERGNASLTLEQEPRVEAALVALDPATGAVRALVGGFDFNRSEFDRAIQARRQAGSSFKPLVYAAAIQQGIPATERVLDEPTVFVERGTFKPYQPENYGKTYYGELTLREALEKSANIATVKLLDRVGMQPVIELARKMGLTTELQPYPSMALGAFEVSLLELTGAYGAFANGGVRVEPWLVAEVRDRGGAVLERAKPSVQEAVRPEVAFVMNRLLEGVVTDGTGAAASALGRPLAGKTGTTDDFTDAWFIGYTPDLVVGVWVGFDQKKSLGRRETGAQAALPIWQSFMETALRDTAPLPFPQPEGVAIAGIDRRTGLKVSADAGCAPIEMEAFLSGTEPTESCNAAAHARLALPYPFQRYPIGPDGALEIPSADLDRLLASEPSVRLVDGGRRLEPVGTAGVSLPVRRTAGVSADALPEGVEGNVDASGWVGADGRKARVILLR